MSAFLYYSLIELAPCTCCTIRGSSLPHPKLNLTSAELQIMVRATDKQASKLGSHQNAPYNFAQKKILLLHKKWVRHGIEYF